MKYRQFVIDRQIENFSERRQLAGRCDFVHGGQAQRAPGQCSQDHFRLLRQQATLPQVAASLVKSHIECFGIDEEKSFDALGHSRDVGRCFRNERRRPIGRHPSDRNGLADLLCLSGKSVFLDEALKCLKCVELFATAFGELEYFGSWEYFHMLGWWMFV